MKFYSEAAMELAMKIQEVILRAMAKRISWWQAAEFNGEGAVARRYCPGRRHGREKPGPMQGGSGLHSGEPDSPETGIQDFLPQPDGPRCNFHQFVVADKLDGLFQIENARRN